MDKEKKDRLEKFLDFMGYRYASVQYGGDDPPLNFVKYLDESQDPDRSILITVSNIENDEYNDWVLISARSIIGYNLQITRPGNGEFSVRIDDIDRMHRMILPIMDAVLKLTDSKPVGPKPYDITEGASPCSNNIKYNK